VDAPVACAWRCGGGEPGAPLAGATEETVNCLAF